MCIIRKHVCLIVFTIAIALLPPAAFSDDTGIIRGILKGARLAFRNATGMVLKFNVSAAGNCLQIFGDVNKDGAVDWDDFDQIKDNEGAKLGAPSYESENDLNHNGGITSQDLALCRLTILQSNDVDRNGRIDLTDFDIIKLYNGIASEQDSYNERADLNHDGIINKKDLQVLAGVVKKWFKEDAYRLELSPRTEEEARIDLVSSLTARGKSSGIDFTDQARLPKIKTSVNE